MGGRASGQLCLFLKALHYYPLITLESTKVSFQVKNSSVRLKLYKYILFLSLPNPSS